MNRIAIAFALVIALCFSPGSVFAAGVVATPKINFGPDIRKVFATYYPKTLAILEADFPADYKTLEQQLDVLQKARGTESARLTAAFVALTAIRKKYADHIRHAPPDSLSRMLGLVAEFHQAVLKDHGSRLCGQFAVNGAGVLFNAGLSEQYAGRLDAQSEAFFSAVVAAIETPEVYDPAEERDWSLASAAMLANGGSADDLKRMAASDPRDPRLCDSMANFFLIVAALDKPFSRRLLADFAPNVTGY